ncbi:MAG: hypothetical protein ACERKO_08880, partial [Acetanaerobacterium sp.]
AEELIALLICERGLPVSKVKTAALLWPDSEENRAMDSLYKTIRHIQNFCVDGVRVPIISTRRSLQLDVSDIDLDTEAFLRLYKSGNQEDWEQAEELYRGALFLDGYYDWISQYEAYFDVRYLELLSRLTDYYSFIGNNNLAQYYKNKANE